MTGASIVFPPPLGIGDNVMLAACVEVATASFRLQPRDSINVFSHSPHVIRSNKAHYHEYNIQSILRLQGPIIFPTYTKRGHLISLACSASPCTTLGYTSSRNTVDVNGSEISIDSSKPFYDRLRFLDISYDFNPLRLLSLPHWHVPSEHCYLNLTEPYALIAPWVAWPERRMSFETLKRTIHATTSMGLTTYVIGGRDLVECRYNEFISHYFNLTNLTGKLSLPHLMSSLKNASLVICNDSGVSNMAQLVSKKILVYFGCTDPATRLFSPNAFAVTGHDKCNMAPCILNDALTPCTNKQPYACMSIDTSEIYHLNP